jgi:phenylalanyl-tRNA synthetase beta chain
MKFSIAWIFNHLPLDWRSIDINDLVKRFNRITAEVEHIEYRSYDVATYTIAQIINLDTENVRSFSPEWGQEFDLPVREEVSVGDWVVLKKEPLGMRYACLRDIGSDKDGWMPKVSYRESGAWRMDILQEDYIIEVDNKSITHRPDLWGHRGMAREIGAILGVALHPLEQFLQEIPTTSMAHENSCTLMVQRPKECKSLAAVSATLAAPCVPSLVPMIFRLACVDIRPINAVVDLTNYVMLDIGAPMHAFDAEAIDNRTLRVSLATTGTTLTLLDGEMVTLTDRDLIIADSTKPVALAGIMGGKASGVQSTTKQVILEAGCFDAATIRHTASRLKKRTEASARFEKSLDADQPEYALRRFLFLAHQQQLLLGMPNMISRVGEVAHDRSIEIAHAYIERKIGVVVSQDQVVTILTLLEFMVVVNRTQDGVLYHITVPPFRATKDVTIPEDIIEEIARFYGYDSIEPHIPVQVLKSWDMTEVMRLRAIKQFLAYGLSMQEVYNYALYDEQFLHHLGFEPRYAVGVQSPISEHWQRLVTSLIPHLLKNVAHHAERHNFMRFFEWGRTWKAQGAEIVEKRVIAGISVHQKQPIDFYEAKQEIERLCISLKLDVSWQGIADPQDPWFAPYESAYLMHQATCIGIIGKVDQTFLHKVALGDAFIFELDGDYLLRYVPPVTKLVPINKYPEVIRDTSCWIPDGVLVDQILAVVRAKSSLLRYVQLIDYGSHELKPNHKAATIRCVLQDDTRTLTKEEVDDIMMIISQSLQNMGAIIR